MSVKLYLNKEDKTQEAYKTFYSLNECQYLNDEIGLGKHTEQFMECDCDEDFHDGVNYACGEDSDCINRLTYIECVNDLCTTCGRDCRNQRFQRKQYAPIAIFQTEKKGYGVRAEDNISSNQFIYEYIGEVITEKEFRRRMAEYDQQKIKHFYFMMLQAGEFIDATKKGSPARFCNHSCNPNAYVSKWVVAGKLKMGIFAKRDILKGEEITFDYNVDRYGAMAQPCYCEEPTCIGFLGGKTQTDAAMLLPKNYADALGVKASIEKKWLKMKKERGESIARDTSINTEFVSSLEATPCSTTEDVNKVMSALLQVDDKLLMEKLLERLISIRDEDLQYQLLRLHGYSCFQRCISILENDFKFLEVFLRFLLDLPKTTKNSLVSSQLDDRILQLKNMYIAKNVENSHANNEIALLCEKLLAKWENFETYTRITKKNFRNKVVDLRRLKLPPGWEIIHENGKPMYYNAQQKMKLHYPPTGTSKTFSSPSSPQPLMVATSFQGNKNGYRGKRPYSTGGGNDYGNANIVNNGNKNNNHVENGRFVKHGRYEDEHVLATPNQLDLSSTSSPHSRSSSPHYTHEQKLNYKKKFEQEKLEELKKREHDELKARLDQESAKKLELAKIIANAKKQSKTTSIPFQKHVTHENGYLEHANYTDAEYKWKHFFAKIVPNEVYRYEAEIGKDNVKTCSKDIVKMLTEREMKKSMTLRNPPREVSKEKKTKIRTFIRDYVNKYISKYKKQ
ncbi:histone methyltransferase SET2 SCDLUD_003961 [Saccharomycodes ludwigii]|uniref:histone methyltransferase SET2 n=1 Tax=Saccharomycodes ludwigii TaxID=36035 RepID=UPI001E83F527|nr:hypothetical protein SCDLUD_003961 [Saccharomycodes ludwigii]KAH3899678.1 hypothetical protein SCDLUD_003961 [Saccharomycodes ludwigii]